MCQKAKRKIEKHRKLHYDLSSFFKTVKHTAILLIEELLIRKLYYVTVRFRNEEQI